MDSFTTTYRQDYLWPYVKTLPVRAGPTYSTVQQPAGLMGPPMCMCHDWCKRGPTGPLLEPRLFSARTGPPPDTETTRFDQPNVYLQKLHEKYPYLYNVLKYAPPDDIMSRVYADRYRTTYQVDYCKDGMFPSEEYDRLLAVSGVCGQGPFPETINLPGDPCRPQMRAPIAFRPAVISSMGSAAANKNGAGGGGKSCAPQVYHPVKSEYADTVSRLGGVIMRDKMHFHGSRGSGKTAKA